MIAALIGYSLFTMGVLATCGVAYFYSEPLEKWFRKKLK